MIQNEFSITNIKYTIMKTQRSVLYSVRRLFLVIPMIIMVISVFYLNVSGQVSTTGNKEVVPLPPSPPPPPPPPPPPASDKKFAVGIKEGNAYQTVDEMPIFPGGDEALLEYLFKNTRYPKEAKEKGIQGQVIARFIVKEDGTVSEVSILKSANPVFNDESIRVIGTLPKFTPGKLKGKAVPVWFVIPITFALK